MALRFTPLEIPEVFLVEAELHADSRGSFWEGYKWSAFANNSIPHNFVQDNFSHSARGVLRGLHYQRDPRAQAKLVVVLSGEIFDVAVDMREGSPTYARWVGKNLAAGTCQMLYIPVGFAHGFCVTSDEAHVMYKVTSEYAPEYERGIRWNDPQIGIDWPLRTPLLSKRDAALPSLADADNDWAYGTE